MTPYLLETCGLQDVGPTGNGVRLPSSVPSLLGSLRTCDSAVELLQQDVKVDAVEALCPSTAPLLRFGHAEEMGLRQRMEDRTLAVAELQSCLERNLEAPTIAAFFGVFDGHGGASAAEFASAHLLGHLVQQETFPGSLEKAMKQAFLQTEQELYQAVDAGLHVDSGCTALAALVWGDLLVVANAGDCRAVLCRRGKAIELSSDHKPSCVEEAERIRLAGGFVQNEYLNGFLGASRSLGDFHMVGLKWKNALGQLEGPLTAEPEVVVHELKPQDEFLLLACDGLWDVFSSLRAVEFARSRLRVHNDPQMCANELVAEAMRMHTGDNVSVMVVCFSADAPPRRSFGSNSRLFPSTPLNLDAAGLDGSISRQHTI